MIVSLVIMSALFFLSVSLPLFGFFLPLYQIRKFEKFGFRRSMLVHIFFLVFLFTIQRELSFIYFAFPFCISMFYYAFYYYRSKDTRSMDEIVITALVSTSIVLVFLFFFRKNYQGPYELALNIWKERYHLSNIGILEIHQYIAKYYPSMIFHYTMLLTFFTYLLFCGIKKYRDWKLHYLWLLPYVFSVFIGMFFSKNNFYLVNAQEIGKGILLWFSIRGLYSLLVDNFKKYGWVLHIASFILAIQYPNFMFILGGILLLADSWLSAEDDLIDPEDQDEEEDEDEEEE